MSLIKKFRIKSFKENKPVIELQNLSISYGDRQIVEKLNLKIQKNSVCGLLGPNGAGKSSIFHSILGIVKPTFGKIFIDGEKKLGRGCTFACSNPNEIWSPAQAFAPESDGNYYSGLSEEVINDKDRLLFMKSMDNINECQVFGKLLEDKLYQHHAIQDSIEVDQQEINSFVDRITTMYNHQNQLIHIHDSIEIHSQYILL